MLYVYKFINDKFDSKKLVECAKHYERSSFYDSIRNEDQESLKKVYKLNESLDDLEPELKMKLESELAKEVVCRTDFHPYFPGNDILGFWLFLACKCFFDKKCEHETVHDDYELVIYKDRKDTYTD